MSLLQTRALRARIPGRQATSPLDLNIQPGQCWAVLGPNGAGKTTLLHTLAGLRTPAAGEILLDERPLAHQTRREIARRIGVLFQDGEPLFPASVWQTALTGRHPHLGLWQRETTEDQQLTQQALAAMDLTGMEHRLTDTLSGGERQRLALATVLIQHPALYLLDEPTNHLDLHHQIQALQLVRQRIDHDNAAAIMALHDVNLAARWCDHVLLISANGEMAHGTVKDILTPEKLSTLYEHPVRGIQDGDYPVFVPA